MAELFDRRSFSEFADFQAGLKTLRVSGIATEPETFGGSVCGMHLPDVTVEIVRAGPALLFGGARRDRAGVLLLLDGADRAKLDGQDADRRDVACLCPGLSVAATFPVAVAFLSTGAGAEAEVLGWPDAPGREPAPATLVQRAPLAAHKRLADVVLAAERAAISNDRADWGEERCRGFRASLLEASRQLMGEVERTPNPRGCSAARQRAVCGADEYLCAHPMRPIYTEDLCKALGVSASVLHEAFHTVFGVSPHRYLKLRRMSLVRAALLSQSGPWSLVKAVALSHGFWHLGQFAQDYKATFGELPPATLARSRPRNCGPPQTLRGI